MEKLIDRINLKDLVYLSFVAMFIASSVLYMLDYEKAKVVFVFTSGALIKLK